MINNRSLSIKIQLLGKIYRSYTNPIDKLRNDLLQRGRRHGHEHWALQNISFDVYRGETIGIIGRNGSGKSTLLQIIAGTLAPSVGEIHRTGRVAALLELGSGFNPEFTGRENVYVNGAIYGISKEVMDSKIDEIIKFADIGEYIDQPVKTYSSGMFARLAFAVGIHVEPDIFIVDEALSVGDIFFQARCVRKLDEFRSNGGTVLFVTHDTYLIERICDRCIVLHKGKKVFEGPSAEAVNHYYQIERGGDRTEIITAAAEPLQSTVFLKRDAVTSDGTAYIQSVIILDDEGRNTTTFSVNEWMSVQIQVLFNRNIDKFDFGVGLRDRAGILIGGSHTFFEKHSFGPASVGDSILLRTRIKLTLAPDNYLLLIGIANNHSDGQWEDYYTMWDCCAIQVVGKALFWGQTYLESKVVDADKVPK